MLLEDLTTQKQFAQRGKVYKPVRLAVSRNRLQSGARLIMAAAVRCVQRGVRGRGGLVSSQSLLQSC
jgi:hypothetical protein